MKNRPTYIGPALGKIFTTLTILMISSWAHGQKDQSAEPFLNKISEDLEAEQAISIAFDFIREDQQEDSKIEGEGSLVLLGEKYKIELGDAIIYFDGEKQYSLQLEIEEVYVSKPDPDNKEFMFTDPIKLLRNYKDAFKYRLIGKSEILGMPTNEVQLFPEELGGPYALIKLHFDVRDDSLKAIVVRHKDGILYTMMVTEFKTIDKPEEGFFRFNQSEFPNVDLIELMQ